MCRAPFRRGEPWHFLCALCVKAFASAGLGNSVCREPPPPSSPHQPPWAPSPPHDALVTGGLEVSRRHRHASSPTPASPPTTTPPPSRLARGGEVLVCATSPFHLLHSGTETRSSSRLDRGAIETPHRLLIRRTSSSPPTSASPSSTPATTTSGSASRRNGDTCVENPGTTAPVLTLADPFCDATYHLIPGQHVLFEHGSLHEVVDNERSPCGCPPAPPPPVQQIAAAPNPGQPTPPTVAAAEHPFPAAASQGLTLARTGPGERRSVRRKAHPGRLRCSAYDAAHPNTPPPSTVEPPKPASTTGSCAGSPTGTGDATSAAPPPTPPGAHDSSTPSATSFTRVPSAHAAVTRLPLSD